MRTSKLLESFGAWARERAETPFFAFVHMWDVHYDYTPPDDYVEMFDADYIGKLAGKRISTTGFPVAISQRDLAHLIARYDGEIRYTDDTLGRMLDVLQEVGHLDDTLVVVTSDHGDEFREHGGKGHMATVYREVVHVPLVMWAGHRLPAGIVEEPVTLADVAPTVLDLLGVEVSTPFDGRSLVPAFRGEPLPTEPTIGELYHRRSDVPGLTMDHLTMASK